MEPCGDERWKLPKKGSRNEYSRCSSGGSGGGGSSGRRRQGDGEGAFLRRRRVSPRKGSSFTRRCASLVKEQRARFYIMRRCVTMLICWREYQDG